jgi:hypothetical protein
LFTKIFSAPVAFAIISISAAVTFKVLTSDLDDVTLGVTKGNAKVGLHIKFARPEHPPAPAPAQTPIKKFSPPRKIPKKSPPQKKPVPCCACDARR